MFIGRKKEMRSLNELYDKEGFSMTVITGRRRIGKSTLIKEFIKDKKAVYYTASKIGAKRNLELFSKQVVNVMEPELKGVSFQSLDALFDFMTSRIENEKIIFVIDELPYWAEKDDSLLSVIQKYIDNEWTQKNMMMILCGSSLSFMENKVLSEKSPLFGRRSSQIKLREFDYIEAAEFVPGYSDEDKAVCYGVTGGVARYLELFDPEESLSDNIKRLFFETEGYLYDEPKNLLVQEFSDITLVNNIIEQIASGENTLNLIADKVHEKPSAVSYSLNRLINVGLVDKKSCITEEQNRKKTQYVLKDNMFKFWYEFIPEAVSVIEMGGGAAYFDRIVSHRLHDYMGSIFEEMCRHFTMVKGMSGEWDCFVTKVGTWWGTEEAADSNGKKIRIPADIDVVGISDIDRAVVVGECKFRNEKIDKTVYETLVRRSRLVHTKYRTARFLLFSLSGFSEWFKETDQNSVSLYTLSDIYSI